MDTVCRGWEEGEGVYGRLLVCFKASLSPGCLSDVVEVLELDILLST